MIMNFSERIKNLRLERGLTQEELSNKLDLPASTIRRYETSVTSLPKNERLKLIADFFDCSIDFLLGRTENRHDNSSDEDIHLSSEEKEVIEVFRALPEEDQKYIRGLMERIQKK